MENRLYYNRDLIDRLSTYIEANPDMRFSQALLNLGYVKQLPESEKYPFPTCLWKDEFYLESSELLDRVKKAMGINNV